MQNQQQEALQFFREFARDWNAKSAASDPTSVNIVRERNDFVLRTARDLPRGSRTLDVGCGTGDLVCDLARQGHQAMGVDFSDAMIRLAEEKAASANLSQVEFACSSIFDADFGARRFDLISANGFIEYVSYDELQKFLSLAAKWLSEAGVLVLGSRNRLFNVFSMNRFTLSELESGAAELLIREGVELAEGASVADLARVRVPEVQPPDFRHPYTGVQVETRFQYTPAQLTRMLERHGFRATRFAPIHVHGVSPAFKDAHPEIHGTISNLLHQVGTDDASLIPFASSFMVRAERA